MLTNANVITKFLLREAHKCYSFLIRWRSADVGAPFPTNISCVAQEVLTFLTVQPVAAICAVLLFFLLRIYVI